MVWSEMFQGLLGFFGFQRSAVKRRLNDETSAHTSKVRRIEELSASESRMHMSQSNSHAMFGGPAFPHENIKISDWEHNGKENSVKPLKENLRPSQHFSNSPRRDKLRYNDVQVLGEVHPERRLKVSQSTSASTGARGIMGSGTRARRPENTMGPDIEIIHVEAQQNPFDQLEEMRNLKNPSTSCFDRDSLRFPQIMKGMDSPLRGMPSRNVIGPQRRKSVACFQQQSQNFHHDIQILQPSNRVSVKADTAFKPRASLLSLDSSSSRCRSTLEHERQAEGISKFNEIVLRTANLKSPRELQRITSINGSRTSDDEVQYLGSGHDITGRPTTKYIQGRMNNHLSSKSDKLNFLVQKKNETPPSTSAVRRQDEEIEIVKERCAPRRTASDPQGDVMAHLQSVIHKYREKDMLMRSLVAEKYSEVQHLGELNRRAELDRQRKSAKEITDKLQKYMVITEEDYEEDIQEIPSLPELTSEMQNEIQAALAAPENKPLVEAFNITIKGRDMHTLRPLAWLNDEVINFYMNLLIERGKSDNYPPVYAFNTFFYPKLVSSGFSSLKRWTRKVDVFANDFLVVPVHLGMHWCVSIIDFKNKEVRYYDSLGGKNQQCLNALLKYLQDEHMDKKQTQYDISGWRKECAADIPQQMNGSDCGMFSCMYAEFVTRHCPITFSQADMTYFRRKMVYEILHKRLLC